ncbi:hypothetical protein AUQ29_03805 [Escherichia coli]|nr:hypothetical protein AUQ29_03805 [Escherichia coli]
MHVSYEKAPRSRKGKGGKVSGKRYGGNVEVAGGSDSPETVMILKPHRVSSNPRLAASKSVKLARGRRSLWKNGSAAAFLFVLFAHMFCPAYPPILWINCPPL